MMPITPDVVIGTDLNRSESAGRVGGFGLRRSALRAVIPAPVRQQPRHSITGWWRLGGGETRESQAAWTGANSQRRGIEPADRQHGDVVGRECRAHRAADRF